MRRFLLLLLVVLMPIRVLGADCMALAMAQSSSQHGMAALEVGFAGMPADCPMLAEYLASKAADQGNESQNQPQGDCQSCDLCMPFATPMSISDLHGQALPSTSPRYFRPQFRSAYTHRELRPPIS